MMLRKIFKWCLRIVLLLWMIFTIVLGMWIWQENSTEVVVSYFGFQFREQTLGTVMTTMLMVGFAFGALPLLLTAVMREIAHRRHVKKLLKQMDKRPQANPHKQTSISTGSSVQ